MNFSKTFRQQGYSLKRGVYGSQELALIREVLGQSQSTIRGIWEKDVCASSRNFLNLATHAAILDSVRELLGDDIVLWGGTYLERQPGEIHPWHTDIESSRLEGGFVSVWIGLEGITQQSSLKLVGHSHDFGKPLQQVIQENDKTRETTTDHDVMSWAAEAHPGHTGISQPDMISGDAIFFDGRMWHGSHNRNMDQRRTALLFQFARADVPVRMPDFSQLDWPFKFHESPLPPCIEVLGQGDPNVNKLVEAPPLIDGALALISTSTKTMDRNLEPHEGRDFLPVRLIDGKTPNLVKLGVHYSSLLPGAQPHPPHAHVDEEILIVLKGSAALRYEIDGKIVDHPVRTGEGVYYPSFHQHTIVNSSEQTTVYIMFKWVGSGSGHTSKALPLQRFAVPPLGNGVHGGKDFKPERCFMGSTQHLKALEAHISTLLPGGGYGAHADEHDVALLVFEGSIQVNGHKLKAGSLHYIPAGDPHDMSNPSDQLARYLVVEFHGDNCPGSYLSISTPQTRKKRRALFKRRSPKRILRNLGRLVGLDS